MYQSINQFIKDWEMEASFTLKVLETLTDSSLNQAVSKEKPKTLGDLGWHLVGGLGAILEAAGLQIEGPDYKLPTPTSAAEISKSYRQMSDAVVTALKGHWNDEKLSEALKLFGFIDTTYAGVLNMAVRHQIHHRGQMTILIRQAGLVPPGIYGPNEEESAAIRAAMTEIK
ncbi:DinB family protein [Paenibacillus silviterrae]|uniref:DinB family protein n=1 Tax=Paenibacillus silviterrae TaxID=3242194 RepID=UPI002542E9AF|nr:DinB family protein [Paenibacillus chinjuensis]